MPKTAFLYYKGMFQFRRMPFGAAVGPAAFQAIADKVLEGIKHECVRACLCDVSIYSDTYRDHLKHIVEVLHRSDKTRLAVSPSKITSYKQTVKFLGHVTSPCVSFISSTLRDADRNCSKQKWKCLRPTHTRRTRKRDASRNTDALCFAVVLELIALVKWKVQSSSTSGWLTLFPNMFAYVLMLCIQFTLHKFLHELGTALHYGDFHRSAVVLLWLRSL